MVKNSGYKTYNNSQVYEGMDPNHLIQMLYAGCLKFLNLAKEGIESNDIPKRGENLGKAIAIISELNSCLDSKVKDESIEFLRGLYSAMLTELPKVSLSNDVKTIDTSISYITRLKEIWENDVMSKKTESKTNVKTENKKSGVVPLKTSNKEGDKNKRDFNYPPPKLKRMSFSA